MQANPFYDVDKPNRHVTVFMANPPNSLDTDREGDVNVKSNPSYGVIRGESDNMGHDIIWGSHKDGSYFIILLVCYPSMNL